MEKGSHLLKVGEFVLNTESRKLYDSDKKEVALAPTLFTLLCFFIRHQNQVCSKEMIIEHVWKGKIVVDANVNQNIKKLRDALGDSANDPQYIETVTGEGFRFVANSAGYKAAPTEKSSKYLVASIVVAVMLAVVLVGKFYLDSSESKTAEIKALYPLTTLKGIEHYPNLSSDKKYLLFNHKYDASWDIYLKPIDKESYVALLNSEADEAFPALSPNQKNLVYFLQEENSCGLYMRSVDIAQGTVGDETMLIGCDVVPQRMKADWRDDSSIFVSINENNSSPSSIFLYDIKTKNRRLVSKPDTKGFGDYAFKYNREKKKLAYVRNIGWSSSEIWVYDLVTETHNKVKTSPLLLNEVDWTSDGQVLFQSEGKLISKLNIKSGEETEIAKFLTEVYVPFEINERQIGVMTGAFNVIDVGIYSLSTNKFSFLINSSFNDMLAASGRDVVAFVSNRSGEQQIWIRDKFENFSQITNFESSFVLSGVSVAADRNAVLFNKSGHINIYDFSGKEIYNSENYSSFTHMNPVFDEINDRILMAVQQGGEWQIEARDLSNLGSKTVMVNGISARPCLSGSCVYFFKDNDSWLYRYNQDKNFSEKVVEVAEIRKSEEWNILDADHILYIRKNSPQNQIVKLNIHDNSEEVITTIKGNEFNFDREKRLLYLNISSIGNTDLKYFTIEQ